jgi:hypothetical protein
VNDLPARAIAMQDAGPHTVMRRLTGYRIEMVTRVHDGSVLIDQRDAWLANDAHGIGCHRREVCAHHSRELGPWDHHAVLDVHEVRGVTVQLDHGVEFARAEQRHHGDRERSERIRLRSSGAHGLEGRGLLR